MTDDVVDQPRWTMDTRVRAALTLHSATDALHAGDPSLALALAEELLDDDPDDLEGLRVVAEAAPLCGHAGVAVLACEQLRRRGFDPGVLELEALLACGRLAEAGTVASRLVSAPTVDGRVYAAWALLLDLGGDRPAADDAWRRAAAADPKRYPALLRIAEPEWGSLLLEALSALDHDARAAARTVPIEFADLPTLVDLIAVPAPYPALPPSLGALLCTHVEPIELRLYRRNLARGAATAADVVERMRAALENELGALPPPLPVDPTPPPGGARSSRP